MLRHIAALTVFFLCLSVTATGAVIHVPADQPTIQAGIDAAVDGDTVLVADGTYTGPGNRDIDFSGKSITVKSENGAENCIIDCQGSETDPHRGLIFQSDEGPSSVVEGFTIQGGAVASSGGGIFCYNSAPTIRGNTISGNSALGFGGAGIYINGSAPVIEANVISGNTAGIVGDDGHGGGIACNDCTAHISDNTISGNTAKEGGGIYCIGYPGPTITGNMISGNNTSGDWSGGGCGIYFDMGSTSEFSNNVVTGNTSNYGGGGIKCHQYSAPIIINNLITDNHTSYAGGIYIYKAHPLLINNTISGNHTDYAGGGMYIYEAHPLLINNTISGNTAKEGGGIFCFVYSSPTITGNVISGNYSSGAYGGGGILFSGWSYGVFSNNVVTGNSSNYGGGGIRIQLNSSPWIINNLITNNHTNSSGGGMHIYEAIPVMKSNTFSGNSAVIGGGGIYETGFDTPIATSSIVWGNMPDQIDGTVTFLYSDIEGGWPGTGNVDADPLFVSGPLGDFYLSQVAAGQAEDSPCMDTGHPGDDVIWGTTRTDQFRDTGVVDMGFHYPWQSVSGQLACIPSSGTLPFQATFGIQLSNNLIDSERTIAAQIDVALAGGIEIPGWKSGTVAIGPDDAFSTVFNSTIPMLPQVVGENTFTLVSEDVTPAPYNQPPYPPSGDMASSECTVEGIAP